MGNYFTKLYNRQVLSKMLKQYGHNIMSKYKKYNIEIIIVCT